MERTSTFHPIAEIRTLSRSMGVKLVFICVLALLMTVPGWFVQGLVNERSQRAGGATKQVSARLTQHIDTYRSVNRALKYILLFEGLIFLTYFIFEATQGKRVHFAQYILVGVAQIIFYLLLLSLAELIGFDWAFLIVGSATVLLLSVNASWIFASRLQGIRALGIFTLLYSIIYVLLRLEDYALLVGAITSFAAVAAAMYFTRSIDWYGASAHGADESQGSVVPRLTI